MGQRRILQFTHGQELHARLKIHGQVQIDPGRGQVDQLSVPIVGKIFAGFLAEAIEFLFIFADHPARDLHPDRFDHGINCSFGSTASLDPSWAKTEHVQLSRAPNATVRQLMFAHRIAVCRDPWLR